MQGDRKIGLLQRAMTFETFVTEKESVYYAIFIQKTPKDFPQITVRTPQGLCKHVLAGTCLESAVL